MVLENLEPKEVFRFFEEICQVPHGTFDTKRISDYCVAFAKERGLACIQDCLLYTSPSPRDRTRSRMPSSA